MVMYNNKNGNWPNTAQQQQQPQQPQQTEQQLQEELMKRAAQQREEWKNIIREVLVEMASDVEAEMSKSDEEEETILQSIKELNDKLDKQLDSLQNHNHSGAITPAKIATIALINRLYRRGYPYGGIPGPALGPNIGPGPGIGAPIGSSIGNFNVNQFPNQLPNQNQNPNQTPNANQNNDFMTSLYNNPYFPGQKK